MTCDFSLNHYDEILHAIEKRAGSVEERKDIILTHDVDISPKAALEMAKLEYMHGVRSTYYVLLHSEWYNALATDNMGIWSQIKSLGHELAFHYNGRFDGDLATVQKAFCAMARTDSMEVSQHLVGITPEIEMPKHLHNRPAIMNEGYIYIADSGGWWRNGCICQHINKRLMCLIHAEWWQFGNESMFVLAKNEASERLNHVQKFWENMINEHRKQKVQIQQRS